MKKSDNILSSISNNKKQIAVLIDPEKIQEFDKLIDFLKKCEFAGIDFIFVGGSTVTRGQMEKAIQLIKANSTLPTIIFPGSSQQLSSEADALLYLSLLSGRNPDFLIGHHIQSAQELFDMPIEIIPTAYLLVDGGTSSSVAYVSQTTPIPRQSSSLAMQISMAGILQGKKLIYMDAGSGADHTVPCEMISLVSGLGAPLIIGGGIKSVQQLERIHNAGANVAVIGNKLESDTDFLLDLASYKKGTEVMNQRKS